MAHVDGLPVAVPGRQTTPRGTRTGPPEHAVAPRAGIHPRTAALRSAVGKQRLQPSPLRIAQIMTINHTDDLPDPLPKIQETRPSRASPTPAHPAPRSCAPRPEMVHPRRVNTP